MRAKIKLLAVLLFKMEGSHRYSDFVVSLTNSVVKHIFASSSCVGTEFPVKMDEQTRIAGRAVKTKNVTPL